MTKRHLLLFFLLFTTSPLIRADLCQSYIDLAKSNATVGTSSLESALDQYEMAVDFLDSQNIGRALISLSSSENLITRSWVQFKTSLLQLERARPVCESAQTISGLALEWGGRVDELDLLEALVIKLKEDIRIAN